MNTRSALVASVAASLLLGITDACAAPYTAFIEGTTALYFDYDSLSYVEGNVGQPFSAKAIFDVANGTLNTVSSPDQSYSQSATVRGCDRIVNGTCTSDSGAQLPVVTDYSVIAPFAPLGGYRPIPTSAYVFDLTNRLNMSLDGAFPPGDIYILERGQAQCNVTGDLDSAYTEECINTYFYVYLATTVHSMFGSLANLFDLNRTPNLADVPPDALSVLYINVGQTNNCTKEVDQDPVCVASSYSPGSGYWLGSLTSLVVMGNGPTTKDACKKSGWKAFGFKNQGQCVSYVNHLP